MDTLPVYSVDALEQLDAVFGSYIPQPVTEEERRWFRLGQRSVVDTLKAAQKRSEEDSLNVRTL